MFLVRAIADGLSILVRKYVLHVLHLKRKGSVNKSVFLRELKRPSANEVNGN